MRTRKLTFRTKLLGITALPLALIGYLSFQAVQTAWSNQQAASEQLEALLHQQSVAQMASAVGDERAVLYNPIAVDEDLAAARAEVDLAIEELRSDDLALEPEALNEIEVRYATLLELRGRIGNSMVPIQEAFAQRDNPDLLAPIEELSLLPAQIQEVAEHHEVTDQETLDNLTTTILLQRAKEALALEGTALQQARAEGAPSFATLERVGTLIGSSDEALDVALDLGVDSRTAELAAYLDGPAWAEYTALREQFTRLLIGQHVRVDPTYVLGLRASVVDELEAREQELFTQMGEDTVEAESQASQDVLQTVGISLGVLVLLGMFMYLLNRSIRRSLGRLERRASQIASDELPAIVRMMRTEGDLGEIPNIERIPVEADDEIGRLSIAFNELQTTATQLAGEQAASRAVVAHMFVNLGRRNQKLLMRILAGLDDLERDESDPDRLAKLYEVDHLATRMRRNAESLLILADASVARRFEGTVSVSELLRSTMTEVAEYDRIKLTVMEDAEIIGDAAADLSHLLAELTENAAKFSPPTETIEIIARYTRVGYIIAVLDSGLGLTEAEILEANHRIAAAANSTETPSKNLGHFVVGKLAGKYGMQVEIFDRVPAGLTVRVRIPRTLIVSAPPVGVIESRGGGRNAAPDPPPHPRELQPANDPRAGAEVAAAAVGARQTGPSGRQMGQQIGAINHQEHMNNQTGPLHNEHQHGHVDHDPVSMSRETGQISPETVAMSQEGGPGGPGGPMPPQGTPDTNGYHEPQPNFGPVTESRRTAELPQVGRPATAARGPYDPLSGREPYRAEPTQPPELPQRPPSVAGGPGSDQQPGSTFGATRRVAGANLPEGLGGLRREPGVDAFRTPADEVGSNLGALQRGFGGTPPADDQAEGDG